MDGSESLTMRPTDADQGAAGPFGSSSSRSAYHLDRPPAVLIADGDPTHVRDLSQALRGVGVEPVTCGRIAEATGLAASHVFDVVVADLFMPGQSGMGLLTTVRGDGCGPKVIVCTSLNDLDTAVACMRQGACDYIRKPCSADAVVDSVLRAAERCRRELDRDGLRESMRRSKHALMVALEARDGYTVRHGMNVAFLARRFAAHVGAPPRVAYAIASVAELHDVGKIGVGDAILNKAGPFTDAEYEAMRFHPQIGLEIIDPLGAFPEEGALVAYHHERWDGGGYPFGPSGDAIPLVARITAVADVFDACTTARPYRGAMPISAALEIIEREAGKGFDPDLAHAFPEFCVSEFGPRGAGYWTALAEFHARHEAW